MKKTKLLIPALTIAGLGATIAPIVTMASCSCNQQSTITCELSPLTTGGTTYVTEKTLEAKAGDKFIFSTKLVNIDGSAWAQIYIPDDPKNPTKTFTGFTNVTAKYDNKTFTLNEVATNPSKLNDNEFMIWTMTEGFTLIVIKNSENWVQNKTIEVTFELTEDIKAEDKYIGLVDLGSM